MNLLNNFINIFKINFPMKGNLINNQIFFINKWKKKNIFKIIKKKFIKLPKFILHDGPPYANGKIHIGHALNKILKDIIIKFKNLNFFYAPFILGWDCHGIPIEIEIKKKYGKIKNKIKREKIIRKYVKKQIKNQKKDFINLGIICNTKYYKTMDYNNQSKELEIFGKILKNGYIYNDLKPVPWCFKCKSCLSDSEINYKNVKCKSLFFGFLFYKNKVIKNIFKIKNLNKYNLYIISYTTNPWTIISNQYLNINTNYLYSIIKYKIKNKILFFILENNLINNFLNNKKYKIISKVLGKELEYQLYIHPFANINKFYNRKSKILLSNKVNNKIGTGIVHLSPSNGYDDYIIYKKYNFKNKNIFKLINKKGFFKNKIPIFKNIFFKKSNNIIFNILKKENMFFYIKNIKHENIFCWRHKTTIIYFLTSQWFINMNKIIKKKSLKQLIFNKLKKINFIQKKNKKYFKKLINKRPDWNISRQRKWGVPITLFINKYNKIHNNTFIFLKIIIKKIKKFGINIWNNINLKNNKYKKCNDILDVWFDSGVTHYTILKNSYKNILKFPADLYLEGIDQLRGWFQSSLITSIAYNNSIPYKNLITHGFVIDKNKKKMSKSIGNTITPNNIINKYGTEIFRLWISSIDYNNEILFSNKVFKNIIEYYRKIRNNIRFMLLNIIDFIPNKHYIKFKDMIYIDKYEFIKLYILQNKIIKLYEKYKFNNIIYIILLYISEELNKFYFDILKDRLYTNEINSINRRSAQTLIWQITYTIIILLSPIISFTSEESWIYFINKNIYKINNKTLFTIKYNKIKNIKKKKKILYIFNILKKIKNSLNKKIELFRKNKKIKTNLQLIINLNLNKKIYNIINIIKKELNFFFVISKLIINKNNKNFFKIFLIKKKKCLRCWNYNININNIKKICNICIKNLFYKSIKRLYI
ncbi:isoleucyl-tRNA synthetase [Candidatus Zinderia insecticola CARI]|uniref:Isoleucine--tRNA ligase n=1 Tax=Zinderia insecticola (strain CARI) TaxID=871271 RepID=E0TIW1_ZINIC|nr:isoleucyl-tRNA synthetase [Candidatus Zinderia insecticola CARI]